MQKKVKVLILSGSIRASVKNKPILLDLAAGSENVEEYGQAVARRLEQGLSLANSEIIAGAAMVGIQSAQCEAEYFPLINLFPPRESNVFKVASDWPEKDLAQLDTLDINQEALDNLLTVLAECDGVVLSTPVYFGDRSSVANKFLQIASVREHIQNKAYSVISVGAKRNGGQETCNVFSLHEMLGQNAFAVGNGQPTSQYGGTAVGGHKGHVLEDAWGLSTAFGSGLKTAQTASIIKAGSRRSERVKVKVTLLAAMDIKDKRLSSHLDELKRQVEEFHPEVSIEVVKLIDNDIYRCLGCNKCPSNRKGDYPRCAIEDPNDYLETVRGHLRESDGFIVCGFNPHNMDEVVTRYQVFTERMRFIRRNNYELSNKLVGGLCYHQSGASINPLHTLKVMVSYIRHNTIIHRPIEIFEHEGTLLNTGFDELVQFSESCKTIKLGLQSVSMPTPKYDPHGLGGGYQES